MAKFRFLRLFMKIFCCKEVKDTFSCFDKDSDGRITVAELRVVMKSLGYHATKAELKEMVKEVDKDGNGTIEFTEFLQIFCTRMKNKDYDRELREAFKIFDKNNDGFITRDELENVMKKLGEKLSDEEIDDMINDADLDGDGKVNYEEFKAILQ